MGDTLEFILLHFSKLISTEKHDSKKSGKHNLCLVYTRHIYLINIFIKHRTGIAEVMGSNPVEASDFFWALFVTA